MTGKKYSDQQIEQALTFVEIFKKADEIDCGGCGYKTCREFAAAMLDGEARPSMCVVLTRKMIEKLKKKDRELRETLFFQQELLDSIPVPVFHEDLSGRFVGCNRTFESLTGKKKASMTGRPIDELLEDHEFGLMNHEINQSLTKNPGRQVVELPLALPGRSPGFVELHKNVLTDRAGDLTGFICLVVDITDRVRHSQELSRAKEIAELSGSLLSKMPSGFVIFDKALKVIDSNMAFATLLGEEIELVYEASPGLKGADLRLLLESHDLFQAFLTGGQESHCRDIEQAGRKLKLSLYAIEKSKTAGAILLDLSAPDVRRQEVKLRAEKVIRENFETVQMIANLLGENASRTENALSAVIKLFKDDEN